VNATVGSLSILTLYRGASVASPVTSLNGFSQKWEGKRRGRRGRTGNIDRSVCEKRLYNLRFFVLLIGAPIPVLYHRLDGDAVLALSLPPSVLADSRPSALLAIVLPPPVLADARPSALLALSLPLRVLAYVRPSALLALSLPPPVLADGRPSTLLALALPPPVLADGRPSTLLAGALDPPVLADARPSALLAPALPLPVLAYAPTSVPPLPVLVVNISVAIRFPHLLSLFICIQLHLPQSG